MSAKDKGINIVKLHLKSKTPLIMNIGGKEYGVKSISTEEFYKVILGVLEECDCKSFKYRTGLEDGKCKHIFAVKVALLEGIKMLTLDECIELSEGVEA